MTQHLINRKKKFEFQMSFHVNLINMNAMVGLFYVWYYYGCLSLYCLYEVQGGKGLSGQPEKGRRALIWSEKGGLISEKGLWLLCQKRDFQKIPVTKGIYNPKRGSNGQKGYPCPPWKYEPQHDTISHKYNINTVTGSCQVSLSSVRNF